VRTAAVRVLVLVLVLVLGACERAAPQTSPVPTPPADGRVRMQVRVSSCVPVGFGLSCASEVRSPGEPDTARATLEVCVGSNDTLGLEARLEKAPLVGAPGAPMSMWMDVVSAPESERYCGVLILTSGAHRRVVDFQR